uniref:Uncharacterized protein n=1 Tax=Anguilla anguilla TaxID=7936 RepID=A0A0E9VPB1_ANGAN
MSITHLSVLNININASDKLIPGMFLLAVD